MSPALRMVARHHVGNPLAWLWILLPFPMTAFLIAISVQYRNCFGVSAFPESPYLPIFPLLLVPHLFGATWTAFLNSEMASLIPGCATAHHRFITRIIAPACLLILGALIFLLVDDSVPRRLAASIAATSLIFIFPVLMSLGSLPASNLGLLSVAFLASLVMGIVSVPRLAVFAPDGPLGPVVHDWLLFSDALLVFVVLAYTSAKARWPESGFRRWGIEGGSAPSTTSQPPAVLPKVSSLLTGVRHRIIGWTPRSHCLVIAVIGVAMGLAMATCQSDTARRIFGSDGDPLWFLIIASIAAPLLMNLIPTLDERPGFRATLHRLSLERLHFPHRSAATTSLMLSLTSRHLLLAGLGLAPCLLIWRLGLALAGETPPFTVPGWIWPTLPLIALASTASYVLLETVIHLFWRIVLLTALVMLICAFLLLLAIASSPATLLVLAVTTLVLVPLAWYRLTNAELP